MGYFSQDSFLTLEVGNILSTNWGNLEVVEGPEWKKGSASKRVLTVKVSTGSGKTYDIGRRKMNIIIKEVLNWKKSEAAQAQEVQEVQEAPAPLPQTPQEKTLGEMIAQAVQPHVKGSVDEEKVRKIIDERLTALTLPRTVVVKPKGEDSEPKDVGVQHYVYEALLKLVNERLNTWLVGPAGSGKSTIASSVAEALDLPFYTTSVCLTTSESKLLGYNGVSDGKYVRSPLREAYEFGGVFLLDEIDLGNPGILAVLNQLMAGDFCGFPDGVVKKHEDFILIAGANTVGKGADRTYNARLQIDGATLDRFIFLEFGYDPAIEAMMCGVNPEVFSYYKSKKYRFEDKLNDEEVQAKVQSFCAQVNKLRESIDELKVRHIVSPRATSAGASMIRAGFTLKDTFEMAVFKGLDKETSKKLSKAADLKYSFSVA